MTTPPRSTLGSMVHRYLARLRYPTVFLILGGLLLVDLVVPDPLPLIDEVLLAVLTFLAGTLTSRRDQPRPPRDVTPPEERGGSPIVRRDGEDDQPSTR